MGVGGGGGGDRGTFLNVVRLVGIIIKGLPPIFYQRHASKITLLYINYDSPVYANLYVYMLYLPLQE